MKFLFINKPFLIEPLGIMYIASAIEEIGHQVDLTSTSENLEQKVEQYQPDFIGYSIMTGDQDLYDKINKKLKQKYDFFSIAGGPHPTFFPEMLEKSSFDAICRGEGENSIKQFLKNPNSKNISNFWFKSGKKIIKNSIQPLIGNLDEISFPNRDIVFKYPSIKNGKIKHFIASRGCPFDCSYCFNEAYFKIYEGKGKRVRFRNVKDLVREIQEVISSSPIQFVYFQDDTFTLSESWLKEFLKEYQKIGLPFHCHIRPNTINNEKISLLKKAGCYSAHIAAETADDRLRNEILNRKMTEEQIINACELLRKHGIRFMLQNIIGLPTGNLEKDLETLELNIKCKPDYAWVSIFQPYPRTELGEFCKQKGFYSGDFDDLDSSFFDSSKLNFPKKYKNQLANLQKLFAIFVEYPELYNLGLFKTMIEVPKEKVKEVYKKAYTEFRGKGDIKLYGFKL